MTTKAVAESVIPNMRGLDTTELSKCFIYLVTPSGGDNFWARVLNGTDKVYLTEGTLAVSISQNGRYILMCNNTLFDSWSVPMRKLALIHEAAHLGLRHIERLFRVITNHTDPKVRAAILTVFNWAADFAVNDAVLREEPEFKTVHRPINTTDNEWHFLMPEEYGFPKGKGMMDYVRLILHKLPEMHQKAMSQMGQEGDGEGEGGMTMEAPGSGESEAQEGPGGGSGSPGQQPKKQKGRGGAGAKEEENDDESGDVPGGLVEAAHKFSDMIEDLQKAFDKFNHQNHQQWNKKAEEQSHGEGISTANKLKGHAKGLVKNAYEQTQRQRGTIPAGVEKLIRGLLAPEQTPWNWIFQDILGSAVSSKVIEEMVMPAVELLEFDYLEPWPGRALDFAFNITWIDDTSGSMGDNEYARACAELNGLLNNNKFVQVTRIQCDAAIQSVEKVDNMQPPDEERLAELRKRKGYGGTSYRPAFRRILNVDDPSDYQGMEKPEEPHPRPDLVIVCTDGGVVLDGEVFPTYHPGCPIIWLLMPNCHTVPGMNDSPPDRVVKMFEIKPEFDS